MAVIISAVNEPSIGNNFNKINKIEADMVHLKSVIDSREFETDYADALSCAARIYYTTLAGNQSLLGLIKKYFQNNMSRGIYILILQDIVDTIVDDNFKTDFFKYHNLAEDRVDIKLEEHEFGTKLSAFNTTVHLKIPLSGAIVERNRVEELHYLISKLGIAGFYYMLKALFKVAAIRRN